MRHMIRLTDYTSKEIYEIFHIADEIRAGKYKNFLAGKTIVLFFPDSSICTRVTFEKGVYLLGGQSILFPPDALSKKENIRDVCGYLNNWADALVIRHKDIALLDQMKTYSQVPVINALTDSNHPCEMLADMYALSKIRTDFTKDSYLFCGMNGNIGLAWKEAAQIMNLDLSQCCGKGYEIAGLPVCHKIEDAIIGKDIICTDSLPHEVLPAFADCQITKNILEKANPGALLNPCPPFFCGDEVSEDAIASEYFVGYEFKKCLLEIQQAVMVYCMG